MGEGEYHSATQKDVLEIVQALKDHLATLKFSSDICDLSTLARCMFGSSTELIRSYFNNLECRSCLVVQILQRALLELNVDFRLLVVLKKQEWIRRFVNYPKLTQYWQLGGITQHPEYMPAIVEQYKSYAHTEFAEEMNLKGTGFDKHLRDRFRSSWYGKDFHARVEEITKLDGDSSSDILTQYKHSYRVVSQFLHPTPYSAIPHFSPYSLDFQLDWQGPDQFLYNSEGFAFLMLNSSARSLARTLSDTSSKELLTLWEKQFKAHPSISRLTLQQN